MENSSKLPYQTSACSTPQSLLKELAAEAHNTQDRLQMKEDHRPTVVLMLAACYLHIVLLLCYNWFGEPSL